MRVKIKDNKPKKVHDGRTKAKFGLFKSKLLTHPAKRFIAEMILKGGHKEFFVVRIEKNDTFKLFSKRYIVNDEYMVYNRTFKMFTCLYHEDISAPFRQVINSKEVKESLRKDKNLDLNVQDAINNIDPAVLEDFANTKVIVDGIQGHGLAGQFGFFKIMLILILVGVVIALLLLVNMSGIF